MSDGAIITFTVDPKGIELLKDYAAVAGLSMRDAWIVQGRLLGAELISRTPPFGGKALQRMLTARSPGSQLKDEEIASMSALSIGKRRVEKDIRRVIYGVEQNPETLQLSLSARHKNVTKGANPNETDWGKLQRCEGKQAVRVFATKTGEVYGADLTHWMPNASKSQILDHHNANRGKRGRVTMAGQKTRNVGRWRWLDVMVVKEEVLKAYIAWKQSFVGQGKGGWASGVIRCGGKVAKWVAPHVSAGDVKDNLDTPEAHQGTVSITFINHSRWASNGDPDRVIASSLEGRAKAVEADIKHRLESIWKTGHPF